MWSSLRWVACISRFREGRESNIQLFRHRHRLETVAAHASEDKVGLCNQLVLTLSFYFKVQAERLVTELADKDSDDQQIIQAGGAAKVAFQMNARQPDVQ